MCIYRGFKRCVILFIGTLAISGFAESNVSFNANGAKSLVAKEIFGVLME
ncbi:MAG: hypothetical protein GX640_14740, partial [Fibrobacter sp.]|nr:hypothetical protein [Fibrobacter sp.]